MIQRIRHPDGTSHDIDHGAMRLGDPDVRSIRYSREPSAIHGSLVAQSDQIMPKVGGFSTERNRRYRARKRLEGAMHR